MRGRRHLHLVVAATAVLPPLAQGFVRATLSDDRKADTVVRRCLADSLGAVTRPRDNEAYAAVDPRSRSSVLAVWQTQSGSGSVIQWSRSGNAGKTWTPPRAAPINACADGPLASATRASDPWASFGPDGRVYLSAIAWAPDPGGGSDLVSALVVVASKDGGRSWSPAVAAAVAPSRAVAHDNLAVTADPMRPGIVYAVTTRAETPDSSTYFGRLGFTRSADGGRTWTPIRPITAVVNRERIGAPQVVVDPRSGRLYAVYHRRSRGVAVVGVMISDDRGDSWSEEVVATPHVRGLRPRHPATGREFVLADDIVQAAVSPTGEVVIAYTDARRAPGGRHDVSLVWSADGRRWSSPLAVSDSGSETAWLPAIATTPAGEIGVAYFTASFAAGPSDSRGMRLQLQRFRLDGAGLTSIGRATVDSAPLDWPGDYQGLVSTDMGFLAVYGRESDIAATRR